MNAAIRTALELLCLLRDADSRLDLSEDELAIHDALEINAGTVKVPGDETLRESVRAPAEGWCGGTLRHSTFPPGKQEKAALLSGEWSSV